jgi:hypothetical protein
MRVLPNIKMHNKEMGWERMDWILLALVGCCEHGNEPSVFIKFWKFLGLRYNYQENFGSVECVSSTLSCPVPVQCTYEAIVRGVCSLFNDALSNSDHIPVASNIDSE